MIAYMRHIKILEYLSNGEIAYLKQLAVLLGVSLATIRRDVKTLEESNHVTMLQGGGVILKRENYDYTLKAKASMNIEEKIMIAKYAAKLINDGDSIYLDSGTTVGNMIDFINQKNLTIFTTNITILDKLTSSEHECILIGGYLKKEHGALVGAIAEETIAKLFFDKAFIGTSAISDLNGASTPDIKEVKKKVYAIEKSKEHYILADSTKLGINSLYKFADLHDSIVISDNKIKKKINSAKEHIIVTSKKVD